MSRPKVLILGASGMLGNALFRYFSADVNFRTLGTLRSTGVLQQFDPALRAGLRTHVDVENFDCLLGVLDTFRPNVVINCIGLVKQLASAEDPLSAIPTNSLLPHRLARLASLVGARFVHVSTDCVFDGASGNYAESDAPNAKDLYGRSKLLGEVDYPNAITLRTSIIGHELSTRQGLVEWFLGQEGHARGFARAIFSGVPTVELARIIRDFVLPLPGLHGLYQVSAEPISKLDLLRLVAQTYGKDITIVPDEALVIDRSLNSDRFRRATGYEPPAWPDLVSAMHAFR